MNSTDTTLDVLREMALEDTGSHMLDSGGAYGRNWQRNQKTGVVTEPEATLDAFIYSDGDAQLDITLNVVPWLAGCLEYDAELDAAWQKFADEYPENTGWMEVVDAFIEQLPNLERDQGFETWVNSYNNEDALSQVIQYRPFTIEDEHYDYFSHVALQIHGGADVRGGYTAPRIFRHYNESYSIMDNARVGLGCGNGHIPADVSEDQLTIDGSPARRHCGANWTSYNAGYEWEAFDGDGWNGERSGILSLNEYELKVVSETPDVTGERGSIVIVQNPDDHYHASKIFCPHCGVGELQAYPY